MPLYEIQAGGLRPFHALTPGPDLYEKEIEDLIWNDLDPFTGETMFPVARQPRIRGGGRPDVVALDSGGRVVVIEVKRDVDRSQLAQCLEYAGWARLTSLDEIAEMYDARDDHRGPAAFFADWRDFNDGALLTINRQPRLFLVARDFEPRTKAAIDVLGGSALDVTVVPVTIYQDAKSGRRIADIDSDHEPSLPSAPVAPESGRSSPTYLVANGRRVTVADLLDAGSIEPGEAVTFLRPRLGRQYTAVINGDGTFTLPDGSVHQSPSLAAMRAADLVSYDGWHAWRVPRLDDIRLHDLRLAFIEHAEREDVEGPKGSTDGVA